MTVALPKLERCFELLHEAALDPTLWRQTLEDISRAADATGTLLLQLPNSDRILGSPATDESLSYYYKHELYKNDIRATRGMPLSLRNGVVVDQDFISEDEMRREPYYQEFLRLFKAQWFAGLTAKVNDTVFALAIQRTSIEGPFIKAEHERLAGLGQKFREVCVIASAVSKARAGGYLNGLELFHQAAALVNSSGHVLIMNEYLRSILGSGLNVKNNRFTCVTSAAERALEAAIRVATTFDPRCASTIGRAVIPFGEQKSLLATIVPYPARHTFFLGGARAIVLFQDPAIRRSPSIEALTRLFNLTLSEARLTAALVRTTNLQLAAAECGLTFGSARQYMSFIFEKTGTSSQVELMTLVTAAPIAL